MSTYNVVLAASAAMSVLLANGLVSAGPDLGREATPAEVTGWDISIPPDGSGLPPGSGTSAKGAVVYADKCLSCHGEGGTDGPVDPFPLVGGIGTLASEAPVKTVGSYWPYATTLFDYTRRAMPYDSPMSLTDDEAYAVTAYILALNGIIPEDAEMNAETLPKVEMPNRNGFDSYWPAPDR